MGRFVISSSGLLVVVCAALVGCGGASSMKTEPVEGIVTLDGSPVAGATVQFFPAVEGEGAPAVGYTDESGKYQLTAQVSGEQSAGVGQGTLPGEYLVGVTKTDIDTPTSQEEVDAAGGAPTNPYALPKATYVVPQRYNNPANSGLKVTVSSGKNDIPLELTSD